MGKERVRHRHRSLRDQSGQEPDAYHHGAFVASFGLSARAGEEWKPVRKEKHANQFGIAPRHSEDIGNGSNSFFGVAGNPCARGGVRGPHGGGGKSYFIGGHLHAKILSPRDYKTLQTLCQTIIPADNECGGAIEAGAPEFIDLVTSENL